MSGKRSRRKGKEWRVGATLDIVHGGRLVLSAFRKMSVNPEWLHVRAGDLEVCMRPGDTQTIGRTIYSWDGEHLRAKPTGGGKRSRDRGNRGELEVLRKYIHKLWPDAITTRNQSGGKRDAESPDIAGVPFRIEVKNRQRCTVWDAMRQAEESRGEGTPVLFMKRPRVGWYVVMRAADWIDLVQRAEWTQLAAQATAELQSTEAAE